MKCYLLILLTLLSVSCNSQEKKVATIEEVNAIEQKNASQIGQYVIESFQDSKGNLWFGTIEKGVARYNGETLTYFTQNNSDLPHNYVSAVVEDNHENLWLGTHGGLTKYDGKTFTTYSETEGLCDNRIKNLLIDRKGTLWIGTWNGVCIFNGESFTDFPIPTPTITTQLNPDTQHWITELKEDAHGNIWIGRDGYGATKFDGKNFFHHLKKDGLYSNNVMAIEIDKKENVWLGSRVAEKDNPDPEKREGEGGLTMLDGKNYTHFPKVKGLNNADVYEVYKDRSDNLWISTTENGVYKYNGKEFRNYKVPIPIMTMTEDTEGNLWLGGAGGLYKITPKNEVINVTINGPWE